MIEEKNINLSYEEQVLLLVVLREKQKANINELKLFLSEQTTTIVKNEIFMINELIRKIAPKELIEVYNEIETSN
jgi:hypothetical protein